MTPDKLTDLRRSLLRILDANSTKFLTTTGHLLQLTRPEGRSWLTEEILTGQLEYLQGKGLVLLVAGNLGAGGARWKITPAGTDEYEQIANQ